MMPACPFFPLSSGANVFSVLACRLYVRTYVSAAHLEGVGASATGCPMCRGPIDLFARLDLVLGEQGVVVLVAWRV